MHLFLVLHSTLMPHWTCHTKNLNASPHTCSELYSQRLFRIEELNDLAIIQPQLSLHIVGSEGKGFFLYNIVCKRNFQVGPMCCLIQWV